MTLLDAIGPQEVLSKSNRFEVILASKNGDDVFNDDTGHFNSVDFNICANQIMHYMIARRLKTGFHANMTTGHWTISGVSNYRMF